MSNLILQASSFWAEQIGRVYDPRQHPVNDQRFAKNDCRAGRAFAVGLKAARAHDLREDFVAEVYAHRFFKGRRVKLMAQRGCVKFALTYEQPPLLVEVARPKSAIFGTARVLALDFRTPAAIELDEPRFEGVACCERLAARYTLLAQLLEKRRQITLWGVIALVAIRQRVPDAFLGRLDANLAMQL